MKARCVHGRITFLSTTGLLGLLILLWLANLSPVHAQLSPHPQIQECIETRVRQAQAEGRTVSEELRRRFEEICRREESQATQQRPQDQRPMAMPGQMPEERVGRGTVLDPVTANCIQRVVQRVPSDSDELTEAEKRRILESCFVGEAAVPQQATVPRQQQSPMGQTTTRAGGGTEAALRRLMEQQLALMREQQRLEQERLGQQQGRSQPAGSDREILDCIRRTLGGLPSNVDVMTDSQRVEALIQLKPMDRYAEVCAGRRRW